ncbi:MAG: glutamate 5-kinase, partial [Pseudomonadota bacterium]
MVADLKAAADARAPEAAAGAETAARILDGARRVALKIGSAQLVGPDGALRAAWLAQLIADVADLRRAGRDVIIISSGAIALGRGALGLAPGPLALDEAQAAAAVGQVGLARAYAEALERAGLCAGQVLL